MQSEWKFFTNFLFFFLFIVVILFLLLSQLDSHSCCTCMNNNDNRIISFWPFSRSTCGTFYSKRWALSLEWEFIRWIYGRKLFNVEIFYFFFLAELYLQCIYLQNWVVEINIWKNLMTVKTVTVTDIQISSKHFNVNLHSIFLMSGN